MSGKSVKLQQVRIQDPLWEYYQNLIVNATLPYQYETLNDRIPGAIPSGAFHNFRVAAGEETGEHVGRVFQDSDIGKWIEAAAYSLCWHADPALEARVDEAIDLIGRAQQPDGYVNTYFILARPGLQFTNLYECHELYTFGHLAEAAVAWYEATGKRNLLNIICRYADLICRTFGPGPQQIHGYDGHQEAELALVKLYRATGEKRYLDAAVYQLEERGKKPYFFDQQWEKNDPKYYFYPIPPERRPGDNAPYNQSHMPPVEQSDAVGHAVRLTYMCIGMSEVARETGDQRMLEACKRLWDSVVNRNMYLTGAVGSTRHGEAFSFDYNLPNDRVYGESCASVGMVLFGHSMLLSDHDARYADVMETELYNTILSAISTDGRRFFYVNPLEVFPEACEKDQDMSHVKPLRQKWFGTACCPPNLARMLASLGGYLCHQTEKTIYVDLYVGSRTAFETPGGPLTLWVEGEYPWKPTVSLEIEAPTPVDTEIALRIPGWADGYELTVNGEKVSTPLRQGYACVKRRFADGDKLQLTLTMRPRFVSAHPAVRQDNGLVALQWGPVVYCLEEADNGRDLAALRVDTHAEPLPEFCDDFVVPCLTLRAKGDRKLPPKDGRLYYDASEVVHKATDLRYIPYFLWGCRNGDSPKEMTVWVREK